MRRRAALLLMLVPAAALAFDLTKQVDAPGAVQLDLPLSTRSLGMGGIAAGGSDILRAWTNPALLASQKSQGDIAVVGGPQFVNQTNFGFGGGYRLNSQWVLRVEIGSYDMSMTENDVYGRPLGTIGEQVTGFGVTGAWRHDWFSAGLSLRGITDAIAGVSTATGAADLGAAGTWGGVSATVALRNFGGKLATNVDAGALTSGALSGSYNESLPTEIRVGGAYTLDSVHLTGAVEVGDMIALAGGATTIGVGAEWWPAAPLAVRAGANSYGGRTGMSAGLTGLWRQFSLDYAFSYIEAGAANRVTLGFAWGDGSAQPGTTGADTSAPREEAAPVEPPKPGAKLLNVAIADLRAENVSSGDAAVMGDILRTELAKTGAFNMVEKQNMDKVLAEQGFQQTGCTNEECAVKLGKLLNVQRMAVGSFGKLLDSYFLNVRVVNIETGGVSFADSAEGATVKDLKVAVRDMARRMASHLK